MGHHRQALMIYVFKMQDYAKAEEYEPSTTSIPCHPSPLANLFPHRYCNQIHKTQQSPPQAPTPAPQETKSSSQPPTTTEEEKPSIYHTLLSLYLTPPPEYSPNLAPALDLLSKHGSRLPATSTLSLVPDSLPVGQLESYFRGRMRSANSAVNETRVLAGLRKTSLLASQSLLFLGDGIPVGQGGRNRRVVISEERVCGVCHKRIGGSVVAVLPDNTVVHYGCMKSAGAGAGAVAGVNGSGARALSPAGESIRSSGFGSWGRAGG
jgi:hypothetical protein